MKAGVQLNKSFRQGISHLVGVPMIDEGCEGEGLFPEEVDHVFKIIDPLLAENLVVGKWIHPVAPLALQLLADTRGGELPFTHGHR